MGPTVPAAAGIPEPPRPGAQPEVLQHRYPPVAQDEERSAAVTAPGAGGGLQPARHWPALDGLRAVAVLAVMFVHVGVLPGGYLGVDVFFVLSGFLITSLLIGEWDQRGGRISFRDFYARRVLRLFPALGCVIVASVMLAGLLEAAGGIHDRPHARATLDAIPWVLVFTGNWARALDSSRVTSSLGLLGHTWSLAVEEQFYVLWPMLFVLLVRSRFSRLWLALSLALIAVADMSYRAVAADGWYPYHRIYYGTDTHSDGLLIGCAAAFWLASGQSSRLHRATGPMFTSVAWLGAAVLMILFGLLDQTAMPIEISAAVLATGAVVTGVVTGNTPAVLERILCSGWAVRIGRRSYGLYLWQYVILQAAEALCAHTTGIYPAAGERRLAFAVILAAAIAVSFILTELSYRFVELPALRLKRRFHAA
jgi:peptidoglycan/LPS O-acetylase OafA/YrhL